VVDIVSELKPGASCFAEYLSLVVILLCVELAENFNTGYWNFDLLRFFSLKNKRK